jgi:hypothetical protein
VRRGFVEKVSLTTLVAMLTSGLAQAGPPLITNDTDTPGDRHWEINIAAVGADIGDEQELAAPDLDINYGFGERIQLSTHLSWNHRRDTTNGWLSAIGAVELAVRWRFLDADRYGFALAIQPHWESRGLGDAVRKALAPSGDEWVLPLQVTKSFGATTLGLEVARHWANRAPDAWQVGVYGKHACGKTWQCLAEVNATRAQGTTESIVNFGVQHELTEQFVLMAALGKQVSGEAPWASPLLYLGIQLLR